MESTASRSETTGDQDRLLEVAIVAEGGARVVVAVAADRGLPEVRGLEAAQQMGVAAVLRKKGLVAE